LVILSALRSLFLNVTNHRPQAVKRGYCWGATLGGNSLSRIFLPRTPSRAGHPTTQATLRDGDFQSKGKNCGDSDEGDRGSGLMVISVPGSNRSVVGAKRRWQLDFVESDHDRQACCC